MTASILIFFGLAFLLVFALRLARVGTLLAFLVAGIIAGPHALGLFQLSDTWTFLGDIGIVFLWFMLGLEINIKRLWQMRQNIFGLGAAQVMMVAAMVFPILYSVTPWSILGVIMVALMLSMSSTATDLQLLADRNELQTNMGRQTFSILLFQDLLAIPLLAMLPVFAGKSINLGGSIIDVLVMSVGLILGVVIVGRFVLNPLMRMVAKLKSKEAFLMAVMLTIIGFAVAMDFIGLPAGLGAFMAGMLLSETVYRHQIKAEISPYALLFMAFFFIVLGMGLDMNLLGLNWRIVSAGVAALIFIKLIAIYIVARVRHVSSHDAFMMALILAQGGEFCLLILQTMKTGGISAIPAGHGELLTAIIVLSMVLTPVLLALHDRVRRSGRLVPASRAKKINDGAAIKNPEVIICGFGRVGQIVARMLEAQNVPYAAIDLDADAVVMGRGEGHNVFYGDSSNPDILRDVGLAPRKTRAVVIALDNAWKAKSTVRAIRTVAKGVRIFARARNMTESELLRTEGVTEALPETVESSFRLGFSVLERAGIRPDKIRQMLIDMRAENYKKIR